MENDQGDGMIEGRSGFLGLLDIFLILVVSVGEVGARVGPLLQQFSDGQPLVQGLFAARHGQALACTHFMPGQCVHHWGVVRGTVQLVTTGPVFLSSPRIRFC